MEYDEAKRRLDQIIPDISTEVWFDDDKQRALIDVVMPTITEYDQRRLREHIASGRYGIGFMTLVTIIHHSSEPELILAAVQFLYT